jgi:hypothetical protein
MRMLRHRHHLPVQVRQLASTGANHPVLSTKWQCRRCRAVGTHLVPRRRQVTSRAERRRR